MTGVTGMTGAPAWPDAVRLDTMPSDTARPDVFARAARSGQNVVLGPAVWFGRRVAEDFAALRLLIAAAEENVAIAWTLGAAPRWGLDTVGHLPPPSAATGDAGAVAAAWRARYRPGRCYYRHGPGFIAIRDLRVAGASFRATLDEPHATGFRELARKSSAEHLTPAADDLLAELAGAGLAIVDGTDFVLLPHRLRTFPIPYTEI